MFKNKMSPGILLFIGVLCFASHLMATGALMPNSNTRSYTLDNGLTLIVREDQRAPVVVAQVWYKVGSSSELRGQTGISHALEHMMFQGSKAYPGDDFATTIAKFGGHNNAFTAEDYTAYYEELAAENLEVALKAEADRMQNLLLKKESFTSELEVVKEERRMRVEDNPQMYTWERFMATANPAGPYHHPVIGWQDDIENLTIEDLSEWYQKWYTPNNAVIVIVGDVKADNVKLLVDKYFAHIPSRSVPTLKPIARLTPAGTQRIQVGRKAKLPMLIMGFSVPSIKSAANMKEAFALYLASSILDQGGSARFAKDILRKELASSAEVSYDLFHRFDSQWIVAGVPTANSNVAELEAVFWKQIKALQTELVSDQELQRVKTQLLAQEIFEKDSMSEQAIILGILASLDLPWSLADDFTKHISAVTKEDIQQVAQQYFIPERVTIAELVPQTMVEEVG
jgi:zinc protease